MKRTILLRLLSFALLSVAMSAPMAQVGTTAKGPLVTVKGVAANLRLPKEVGKVLKIGPTGALLPNAPDASFATQSEKGVGLCYLGKSSKVTCAPIIDTPSLAGVTMSTQEVNGFTLVRFRSAVHGDKRVRGAARKFMVGLSRAALVLDRHAKLHAGDLAMPSVIKAGGEGGSSCTFDEEGGMSCTGGGIEPGEPGGGGSGTGNGGSDPTGGSCWDCDFPPQPPEPTVPATNASEPCTTDNDGNTVCVMSGPRLPMPTPPAPPPGGIPSNPNTIPPVGQIQGDWHFWPTIDWCAWFNIGCTASPPKASEQDNDRGANSSTSGKSMAELVDICYEIYDVEMDVCSAYRASSDNRSYMACTDRAATRRNKCRETARDLTNNGTRLAP